jgi:hypothetical protein
LKWPHNISKKPPPYASHLHYVHGKSKNLPPPTSPSYALQSTYVQVHANVHLLLLQKVKFQESSLAYRGYRFQEQGQVMFICLFCFCEGKTFEESSNCKGTFNGQSFIVKGSLGSSPPQLKCTWALQLSA